MPCAYYKNPNAVMIMSTTLFISGMYFIGMYFLMFYYKETKEEVIKENIKLKDELKLLKENVLVK